LLLGLLAAAGIAIGAASGAALIESSGSSPSDASSGAGRSGLPTLQTGKAPWIADSEQLPTRLSAIDVPFSGMAGTALHIHPHLSVFTNSRSTTVPTEIGINYAQGVMAALHTHDTAGTIHVESPVVRVYTLGQFFDVWGVRLTPKCLGGYCTTRKRKLRACVHGEPAPGQRYWSPAPIVPS
jgi:hypothetical protein